MKKAERASRRQQIIHLYCEQNLPITMIAKQFGVSRQAIYAQLAAAAIDTRPRKKRNIRTLEYEELHCLYVEKKVPVHQITKILKASSGLIERELKRHNIELRPSQYRPPRPSEIDNLKVGDSCIAGRPPSRVAYCNFYSKARRRGMEVSCRRIDSGHFRVTRIK